MARERVHARGLSVAKPGVPRPAKAPGQEHAENATQRIPGASAAFILTWNPTKWAWDPSDLGRWSVGNRTSGIEAGDYAYLLRQHDNRGLIASGMFVSGVFQAPHWDGGGTDANYARVEWDTVLDPVHAPAGAFSIDELKDAIPHFPWNNLMSSGVQFPTEHITSLASLWRGFAGAAPDVLWPDEAPTGRQYVEGSVTRVLVNRYERSSEARRACIARWGLSCYVCDMDFGTGYGDYAQGTIEVHHIVPISEVGEEYTVDPINDLRPVCPNCHAALHKDGAPTMDDMRAGWPLAPSTP